MNRAITHEVLVANHAGGRHAQLAHPGTDSQADRGSPPHPPRTRSSARCAWAGAHSAPGPASLMTPPEVVATSYLRTRSWGRTWTGLAALPTICADPPPI